MYVYYAHLFYATAQMPLFHFMFFLDAFIFKDSIITNSCTKIILDRFGTISMKYF